MYGCMCKHVPHGHYQPSKFGDHLKPGPSSGDAKAADRTSADELAYGTTQTKEQLQARLVAAREAREALGRELSEALSKSRGQGTRHPPAAAAGERTEVKRAEEEEEALSVCLMGRLNPHLFPGTPQV